MGASAVSPAFTTTGTFADCSPSLETSSDWFPAGTPIKA